MPAQKSVSRVLRSAAIATAGLGGLSLVLWIVDSGGTQVPATLSQIVLIAFDVAVIAALASLVYRSVTTPDRELRHACWVLLALVALSLTISLIGIDHEVGRGYYRDEGHYLKHAGLVSEGRFFTHTFIYPHLLYYIDSFGLWVASLFPAGVELMAGGLYGVPSGPTVDWLVLRWIAATCGALTVIPVFLLARRLGGLYAGLLGGLAIALSPIYSSGFSVNISDGPAAFFAACCFAASGSILDDERIRNYLLAGLAAGMAAGCKYPAGVVAVAIVGVWVYQRISKRDLRFGLLWAGLAALAVFVLTTPSFLVYPQGILGPQGIFFGVNQYGKGGWIGVMPQSNTVYYLKKMVENFGWPLILLGVAGLTLLDREGRRRTLAMSPFPVLYFTLICAMAMVVARNLFPLLPAVAAILGVGSAAALTKIAGASSGTRRAAAIALGVAVLAIPAVGTAELRIGLARPSTRDLMMAWVRDHLPRGSVILKESYTPNFSPREYGIRKSRFAARLSLDELLDPQLDVLLLARNAYQRFMVDENLIEEHHKIMQERYQTLFDTQRLLHEEVPGRFRQGPSLRLYQSDPQSIDFPISRAFSAEDAFRPARPRKGEPTDVLVYSRNQRWTAFRGYFSAGVYHLNLKGSLAKPALLEAKSRDGRIHVGVEIPVEGLEPSIELPEDGKYILILRAAPGSRVERISLTRYEG